jgi:BlaI family transcriptional regulator, penicillinase repressor
MKAPNISESEWTVMEALWEQSPQTASAVAKVLHESTSWAENTVRTLLTRLVDKGALVIVDPGVQPRSYAPAVKRELCVQAESASFIDRIFRGASKPLLVHFARTARLTEEDARELKKLLDQSISGTTDGEPSR